MLHIKKNKALQAFFLRRKTKTEMVINQEELKVTRLTYSTLIEDEQNTVCRHINYLIEVYSKLIVSI